MGALGIMVETAPLTWFTPYNLKKLLTFNDKQTNKQTNTEPLTRTGFMKGNYPLAGM